MNSGVQVRRGDSSDSLEECTCAEGVGSLRNGEELSEGVGGLGRGRAMVVAKSDGAHGPVESDECDDDLGLEIGRFADPVGHCLLHGGNGAGRVLDETTPSLRLRVGLHRELGDNTLETSSSNSVIDTRLEILRIHT